MKNALDILKMRGFIKQTVFEEELREELGSKMVSFYWGIDPTATSMTIGHFSNIFAILHLQKAGHKPYLLLGGGTAHVGDPSDRSDMRPMMTKQRIDDNVAQISTQLSKYFVTEGKNKVEFVNNADWLLKLNYVDFIREIGPVMSVNRMLGHDCFKSRWEKGLSFLELNYMPMQAYDFLHLNREYGITLQVGGDDQWANILAGANLIRRKEKATSYAVTFPLLLTADGKKMGKSAKGALWADKERTSPYELYQYFRNVDDSIVEEYLKRLTFLSLEEITELTKHKDERMNRAKEVLAFEFIKFLHSEVDAIEAEKQAKGAFGGNTDEMPTLEVKLTGEEPVVDILCLTEICKSKSEARRLIQGGAVKVDERKILDVAESLTNEEFKSGSIVLHKGKKVHLKVTF